MIEEDVIAFGHSKVHTVKPYFGEADVLHLGLPGAAHPTYGIP